RGRGGTPRAARGRGARRGGPLRRPSPFRPRRPRSSAAAPQRNVVGDGVGFCRPRQHARRARLGVGDSPPPSHEPTTLPPPNVLSVVIPVFNEEVRLRETLAAVARHLSQLAIERATGGFEIVVSDDGSRDRSVAIAEEAARDLPIRLERG